MVTLKDIESDLITALKAKDTLTTSVLRGLKTRIQNEQITKGDTLTDAEMLSLMRSEIKRRNEAASGFDQGGKSDMAQKERDENIVISKYLPPEVPETQIIEKAATLISEYSFSQKEMGKLIGLLKSEFPTADGAVLARIAKEKLS